MSVQIQNGTYLIDGKQGFLMSGEFHYFRVPKADWRRRLLQFKELYGNCVATYIPWRLHEPTEGKILFGDTDYRDLAGFLDLCSELGISVMLRPGPLQYSELVDYGLPSWLCDNYPEVQATRVDGSVMKRTPSYWHPVFLQKARRYFAAVAEIIKPYLADRGGPVWTVQLDNETMGCQVWQGSLDFNRESNGIGKADGAYPAFLTARYGTVEKLNAAYCTDHRSFADVVPCEPRQGDLAACRRARDYVDFYLSQIGIFLRTLGEWLREDGVTVPFCTNSGCQELNGLFQPILKELPPDFLLGVDHYYNLGVRWDQNSPTPQSAVKAFLSLEQMRNYGMPQTVLEMQGGNASDFPPILPEDIKAWYLTHLAFGMKGWNIYVFTGGPQKENSGETCDIYDYDALIRADGAINPTYYAVREVGKLLTEHPWLQNAHRVASVSVGYENRTLTDLGDCHAGLSARAAANTLKNGILYSLFASEYAPQMTDLEKTVPDLSLPLIVCSPASLSEKAQENVARFVRDGGKLILFGELPTLDEQFRPCTVLKDALGITASPCGATKAFSLDGCEQNIYQTVPSCEPSAPDGRILGRTVPDGRATVLSRKVGKGEVVYCAFSYQLSSMAQVGMMRTLLRRFDARPAVFHDNPHVFTSLLRGENGEEALFAMNLYSGANTTTLAAGPRDHGTVTLSPMEVKVIFD